MADLARRKRPLSDRRVVDTLRPRYRLRPGIVGELVGGLGVLITLSWALSIHWCIPVL